MGGKGSREIQREEINELIEKYSFSELQLRKLWESFQAISTSITPDETIDQDEFRRAMGLENSFFASRLFRVQCTRYFSSRIKLFDANNDKIITFPEFVEAFSIFSPHGSVEQKASVSFRIYDVDGNGFIDKSELFDILKASLYDIPELHFSDEQLHTLVASTFAEVDSNSDGRISLDEYVIMCKKHPLILENLTISVDPARIPTTVAEAETV